MMHFSEIINGILEFDSDLSEQGKNKVIREICTRIKKLEEKSDKKCQG